jgi:hypothetical protein
MILRFRVIVSRRAYAGGYRCSQSLVRAISESAEGMMRLFVNLSVATFSDVLAVSGN